LINIIDSDFFARVISRLVIIRIYDFITLTRQYNNSFVINSTLKRELRNKLNLLSDTFEDKLKIQRHKLSAHFQDLEFANRVDSWSNITKIEIDIFYIKILEIYNLLENQNDYQEILESNFELSQQDIINIQNVVSEKDIESTPHFSNDILSITRTNTGAIIPCHPIQDKILSLNSIHLMIDFEILLYKNLEAEIYKQLIKTILINDIVSFIDNLITRTGSQYIGLDNIIDLQLHPWNKFTYTIDKPNNFYLIKQSKYDFKPDNQIEVAQNILNTFLLSFKLNSIVQIRNLRNKLGSHIDTIDSIEDIVILLNDLNTEYLIKIYSNFYHLFLKICNSVKYLQMLIMPPTKMNGISAISPQPEKMFFDNINVQTEFDREDINDEKLYGIKFKQLLNNKNDFEEFEYYFREALSHSNVLKNITFEDKNIDLNICHTYFLNKLNSEINIDEKRLILLLLKNSSGLSSKQITYILTETYQINKLNLNYEYLVYFGDTTKENSTTVLNILLENLRNTDDFNIVYYAILSLLKIDISIGGFVLFKNRQQAKESKYSKTIKQTIERLSPLYKVIVIVLLKSEMMFTNHFSHYRDFYKELYLAYFQKIFIKNIKLLKPSNFLKKRLEKQDINELKLAFKNNNLTIIFIKLAEKSNSANAEFLYSIIVNSLKLNFQYLPFIEHYAYANYKIGNIDKAVEVYQDLVDKNPEEIEYRIELLTYYLEQKNISALNNELSYIENTFKISEKQQEKVNSIKQALEDQQNIGTQ
jgi:hypothetical protein